MKILAVDDIPDNLFILDSILGEVENYQIDCVNDGKAALKYVSQQAPDLILLDAMMPGLDGYQVTRRIRRNKALPYIPILLVSAHDQSSLSEGLDSGADDFIRKPFDIDELMARVRSLLRLKKSLDEQSEMLKQRDDFVARLTHDLRTPLVAANRMLGLTLEGVFGEPPAEMEEAISSVISNNDNLLKMTNTLLQVYRHEAGHKNLAKTSLSLCKLTSEVVNELSPLAAEKNLTLTLKKDQPATDVQSRYQIEGDVIELRRLITNLIGNAIKFTDSGSIVVQLSLSKTPKQKKAAKKMVNLAVQDTGIGMTSEEKEQVFAWFYQGDHMRAGSGLGLHLAKRIALMHGGDLCVESESGKGSTFTLSLPK